LWPYIKSKRQEPADISPQVFKELYMSFIPFMVLLPLSGRVIVSSFV
jgi:hypothetical protein